MASLFTTATFLLFFLLLNQVTLFLQLIFELSTIRRNVLVDLNAVAVVAVVELLLILASQAALPVVVLGLRCAGTHLDGCGVLYEAMRVVWPSLGRWLGTLIFTTQRFSVQRVCITVYLVIVRWGSNLFHRNVRLPFPLQCRQHRLNRGVPLDGQDTGILCRCILLHPTTGTVAAAISFPSSSVRQTVELLLG